MQADETVVEALLQRVVQHTVAYRESLRKPHLVAKSQTSIPHRYSLSLFCSIA